MQRTPLNLAQRTWLEQELTAWQAEQLVSPEQAGLIRGRYESIEESGERSRSTAVHALWSVAAFLFGLAVLLLIGFNWEALSRPIKLITVLVVVSGTHLGAHLLRRSGNHATLANVVSFLGCLFFGAGIWLIGQAFHLDAHYPDGVWWWAVGVLPFAILLDSLPIHLLFVGLLALWAGMEVFNFSHLFWFRGWLPNGAWSLPLLAAPGLAWAYYRKSPFAVALYVPLIVWWVVLQAFSLNLSGRSVFWIGNVGAILILFAEAHRPRDPRGKPYRFWGVAMASVTLLIIGSMSFWNSMSSRVSYYDTEWSLVREAISSLVLLCGSAGLLFALRGAGAIRLTKEAAESDSAIRRRFAIAIIAGLMISSFWSLLILDERFTGIVPVVIANVLTLGLALYLMKVGQQEDRLRPFATGVLTFLVWAVVRYIDLFGADGGMIGAALLFALCGGSLIVVARFWTRNRQAPHDSRTLASTQETTTPAWITRAIEWADLRRAPILKIAIASQIGLLVAMIVLESLPLMVGQRVVLRVVPLDPRDYFRGDYVILNYDFNRITPSELQGETQAWNGVYGHVDEAVYVPLAKAADGDYWDGKTASMSQPNDTPYLRGRITGDYRQPVQFGIEAYYVQEGTGKVLEEIRNGRRLMAEVAVSPWGKAKLVRLFEDPTAPAPAPVVPVAP